MGKIVRLKTTRLPISLEDFQDMLNTVEVLVKEARPETLKSALPVLQEMHFCAYFCPHFREAIRDELQELIDDLYEESQGEND